MSNIVSVTPAYERAFFYEHSISGDEDSYFNRINLVVRYFKEQKTFDNVLADLSASSIGAPVGSTFIVMLLGALYLRDAHRAMQPLGSTAKISLVTANLILLEQYYMDYWEWEQQHVGMKNMREFYQDVFTEKLLEVHPQLWDCINTITTTVMLDPVKTHLGTVYDRHAILEHIKMRGKLEKREVPNSKEKLLAVWAMDPKQVGYICEELLQRDLERIGKINCIFKKVTDEEEERIKQEKQANGNGVAEALEAKKKQGSLTKSEKALVTLKKFSNGLEKRTKKIFDDEISRLTLDLKLNKISPEQFTKETQKVYDLLYPKEIDSNSKEEKV